MRRANTRLRAAAQPTSIGVPWCRCPLVLRHATMPAALSSLGGALSSLAAVLTESAVYRKLDYVILNALGPWGSLAHAHDIGGAAGASAAAFAWASERGWVAAGGAAWFAWWAEETRGVYYMEGKINFWLALANVAGALVAGWCAVVFWARSTASLAFMLADGAPPLALVESAASSAATRGTLDSAFFVGAAVLVLLRCVALVAAFATAARGCRACVGVGKKIKWR